MKWLLRLLGELFGITVRESVPADGRCIHPREAQRLDGFYEPTFMGRVVASVTCENCGSSGVIEVRKDVTQALTAVDWFCTRGGR